MRAPSFPRYQRANLEGTVAIVLVLVLSGLARAEDPNTAGQLEEKLNAAYSRARFSEAEGLASQLIKARLPAAESDPFRLAEARQTRALSLMGTQRFAEAATEFREAFLGFSAGLRKARVSQRFASETAILELLQY